MNFSENGVEAARHELLVDGGLVSNAGLYNQDLNVNIYSEMVFHIRKFLRMGVKFVDASSKICLREAVVGAVAVEAVLSASGARLTGIARAALSTRAAREPYVIAWLYIQDPINIGIGGLHNFRGR